MYKHRIMKAGLVAGLFFIIGICSGSKSSADVPLPPESLNDQEIEALVSGNTIVAQDEKGRTRTICFFTNGELRQIEHDGDYERGQWKAKDDRLCIRVRGDRDCRAVVREAGAYRTYIVKLDGDHLFEEEFISVEPGNMIFPRLEDELAKGIPLPPGTLNAEEVMNLFYDMTIESVTAVKERGSRSYYDPSGEISQYRNGKKRVGRWWVKENGRICLQMEGLPQKCRIIVKEGGEYKKYIVKKNGRHVHSVSYPKFRKGNPYHI